MIESEVFGHEQGAFTGATRARPGVFELANGGTLFLDEIAEMPISLQPKLLRILEDGRARRLGGSKEVQFDVRVLAATNRAPAQAIRDGMLREDLFYRLNVFEVALPPLRERSEDIGLLAQHFVREFGRKHQMNVEGVGDAARELLESHPWPGNVRELRNVIERAVIVARSGWIEPRHLPPYLQASAPGGQVDADASRRDDAGRGGAHADPSNARARGEQQGRSGASARARREDDPQQAAQLRTRRMKVANRLRGAFGFYIALLAVLLLYQVRTIQHTVDSEHELAAISFRLGVTSTEQLARITQMGNYAEKYFVTARHGLSRQVSRDRARIRASSSTAFGNFR